MIYSNIATTHTFLTLKPISDLDLPFLYKVYRSTRLDELQITGWSSEEIDQFLKMQFTLQHNQYMDHYKQASFHILICNDVPIGRLYIHRSESEIRIIDIALLFEFRNKGIGSKILKNIITESQNKKIPISLHVEYNNPAINLYKRLGFEPESNNGIYIFMKRFPKST